MMRLATNLTGQLWVSIYATSREDATAMQNEIVTLGPSRPGVQRPQYVDRRRVMTEMVRLSEEIEGII
jgi:hypothetical protein